MCGIRKTLAAEEKKNGQSARESQGCLSLPSILNRDSRDEPHKPHTHTQAQTTASSEVQFHRA